MKSNLFWLIVLGGVVAISALAIILPGQVSASYARIYHNGELTETVNIIAVTDLYTITIESGNSKNTIAVEHGRIRMQSADCPDGTCVRQGWSSKGAFPIVCLPNRVVIVLDSGESGSGVDAVVG